MNVEQTEYGRSILSHSRNSLWLNLLLNLTNSVGVQVRGCSEHWDNLNYLKDLPPLKVYGLGYGLRLQSIEGLYSQARIKKLSLDPLCSTEIDWSVFLDLENLYVDRNFIKKTFWKIETLRDLCIFKPRETNWDNLNQLSNLVSLRLIQTRVQNLKDLALKRLQFLEIRGSANFNDLQGMVDCGSVGELRLLSCPNLHKLDGLERFWNLKRLFIIECGDLQSLSSIANLENLSELYFPGTKIADGKIKYLLRKPSLEKIDFSNYRGQDITIESANNYISSKTK